MALKIKKQIKNSDGTITELEGTEAEVEAFLRKQEKKKESIENRKKDLILGKSATEQIRKLIQEEIAKIPPARDIHHWHYDNGYWWRPLWANGVWTYQYTQANPNTWYSTAGLGDTYGGVLTCANISSQEADKGILTCNSALELGNILGTGESKVQEVVGVYNFSSQDPNLGLWSTLAATGTQGSVASNFVGLCGTTDGSYGSSNLKI